MYSPCISTSFNQQILLSSALLIQSKLSLLWTRISLIVLSILQCFSLKLLNFVDKLIRYKIWLPIILDQMKSIERYACIGYFYYLIMLSFHISLCCLNQICCSVLLIWFIANRTVTKLDKEPRHKLPPKNIYEIMIL